MEQIQNILLDCQRSDPQAQRALYDLYKVELLQLCRRYAQDEATAKDIFQEGFVRIFKDLHQYDPNKGQFKHWIKKVMVNSALQHIRAHKKWKGYLELNGIPKEDLTYMDRDMEQMDLGNIYDLITKMPEGYRIVFNMYIIEGYSHKEIASFMGSSEGTSKSQLHKAKQWLRSKLVEMDPMYGKQYGRQVVQG